LQKWPSLPGLKAIVTAGDYSGTSGPWGMGFAARRSTQHEANALAFGQCESQREKYGVTQPCKLYYVGDQIVNRKDAKQSILASTGSDEAMKLDQLREENRKLRRERRKEEARIAEIRKQAEEATKQAEAKRIELAVLNRETARKKPKPKPPAQSGLGSGFFVSKAGHVITNAHVVKGCNRLTVGDSANNQTSAVLISSDSRNDLALLKLGSLETASAETKSLVRQLGLKVVPLAGDGLLRSEDVRLGESVLVAGFPYGNIFSNTIKVTGGMVSSVRGIGDDSAQFQMDAAVQSGNSGGPIYDSRGNVVGVVVAQLNKLKVAKALGSLPENVNFGIKASTVRQFMTASGLPSKWSKRTKKLSTEALAKVSLVEPTMSLLQGQHHRDNYNNHSFQIWLEFDPIEGSHKSLRWCHQPMNHLRNRRAG